MSKRINNNYTKEFKLKAVKMYLDEGVSYKQVASKLNIKSKTQVINWVKQFQEKVLIALILKLVAEPLAEKEVDLKQNLIL